MKQIFRRLNSRTTNDPVDEEEEKNADHIIFVGQGGYDADPNDGVAWYFDKSDLESAKQLYRELLPAVPDYILTGAILMDKRTIKDWVAGHRSLVSCLHLDEDIKKFLTFMVMLGVDIKPYKEAREEKKHASFYTKDENNAIKQHFMFEGDKHYMQDPPYVLGWYTPKENDRKSFPYTHDHISVDMTVLNIYLTNKPSDA